MKTVKPLPRLLRSHARDLVFWHNAALTVHMQIVFALAIEVCSSAQQSRIVRGFSGYVCCTYSVRTYPRL